MYMYAMFWNLLGGLVCVIYMDLKRTLYEFYIIRTYVIALFQPETMYIFLHSLDNSVQVDRWCRQTRRMQ